MSKAQDLGFVSNPDWHGTIQSLSDEEAGRLYKYLDNYNHCLNCGLSVPVPPPELFGGNPAICRMFTDWIDKRRNSYRQKCDQNKENALKRRRSKANSDLSERETNLDDEPISR